MRHVEIALREQAKKNNLVEEFIVINNPEDVKGVVPVVSFAIQSDPIGEVGVNGVQATDMLEYVKHLFQSLNATFPCRENSLTITKIEEALHWQEARTKDRELRKVEGKNLR
jgi:hypothetical protein